MVKINSGGDPDLQAVLDVVQGKTVDSEEEYREFVSNYDPPDGYVWSRSPFTAEGKWKVSLAKEAEYRTSNTDLEQEMRSHLEKWDYLQHFEHDYRLSDGRQIDFADPDRKVALEPGAAYWHTPDEYAGETKSEIGEHPEEVYSPPTESDLRKQERLVEDGWDVLWISENGVSGKAARIKMWLDQFYVSLE